MSETNISHAGAILSISDTKVTNRVPIPLMETADDADPMVVGEIVLGDLALDTNGNSVFWSTAAAKPVELNLTSGSVAQQTVQLIFNASITEAGRRSTSGLITLSRILPNGEIAVFSGGRAIGGKPVASMLQSGRLETMNYKFKFASVDVTPAVIELLS